ncbi:MAG: Glu-tRNA(Gln) amidotransferase subunit GatD [Candidatus Micrarchaeota archaeon]
MYSKEIQEALIRQRISEGDLIRISSKGLTLEGVLLPKTTESDPRVLTLKLASGYNAGFLFWHGASIEKLRAGAPPGTIPKISLKQSGLPKIAVVATGGTIGTHVDYTTGGVFMCRTPEEVLATTPELERIASIKSVSSPFTLASEDIQPHHWVKLAHEIARHANDPEIQGIVVTHGTDALGYTSAALSFMLRGLHKPVALVGAQRSPDRGSFDGSLNLVCGAYYAAYSSRPGVAVVMHGSTSDDFCYAHSGVKVRKMHSSRRDAFQSINAEPLAKIFPDGKIEWMGDARPTPSEKGKCVADAVFEEKVAILKSYPGSDPGLLDHLVEKGFKGVVIEAMALGHLPTGESGTDVSGFDRKKTWIPAVKRAVSHGVVVAITSQSINGPVHPHVYRNLRLVSDAGALYCRDMLAETAYAKLGWVLGHRPDATVAKKMMLENVAGEFNDRIRLDEFK